MCNIKIIRIYSLFFLRENEFEFHFFPPVTTTAVMRAVERLRNDVNRINPFYRLTINIYHGNYKFSQPERKKGRKNFQPKQRKFKRQKFAKRPPLLKSLQRARKRIPVRNTNNIINIVLCTTRPSNHRPIIANSEHNLSEAHSDKLINGAEVQALVTEMHEMIHQILQNQELKDKIPEEKQTFANAGSSMVKGTEKYWKHLEEKERLKTEISHPSLMLRNERNNLYLAPVNSDPVESSSEDPFLDKLDELIATIERIKRNPVWKEQQQEFSPSLKFDRL